MEWKDPELKVRTLTKADLTAARAVEWIECPLRVRKATVRKHPVRQAVHEKARPDQQLLEGDPELSL
jgi:hypothetical protein